MTTVTLSVTTTSRPVLGNGGGGGGAIPPSNTVAPLLSGTPTVGQTLSCSTGTWLGTLPITYTYQWRRGVSNILGATSSTYTLVQADASFAVTCIVTATNAAGSADSTSNSLAIVDADAQAFITAAGITDNTQKTAINTLVVDMKGFGIWTKMKAIYPFVGGTASTHKFNLKNPADTNAAFRLVFNGGWTHSANGALPNGTNGYANTFLNSNTSLTLLNTHLSFYSRTVAIGNSQRDIGAYMGQYSVPSFGIGTNTGVLISDHYWFTTNRMSRSIPNAQGLMLTSRINDTTHKAYRNGIQLGATDTVSNSTNTMPNAGLFIGAANSDSGATGYSNKQYAFMSIGDGLTDTEAANFYTAVQNFNTTLTRNV
jgi:hypothetical protein